jgi:hypothetical protein
VAFVEAQLERLRQEQVATQARLAEFPQFRAVAAALMTAEEMQALLAPGEAYVKLDRARGTPATPARHARSCGRRRSPMTAEISRRK